MPITPAELAAITTPTLAAITCGHCGHMAALESFTATPIGGELPLHHFQCPACHRAWQIRSSGPPTIGWSGMLIPPSLVVAPTDSRL